MAETRVYKRRRPERTDYYRIIESRFEELERMWPECFEQKYGYLRKEVVRASYRGKQRREKREDQGSGIRPHSTPPERTGEYGEMGRSQESLQSQDDSGARGGDFAHERFVADASGRRKRASRAGFGALLPSKKSQAR